MCIAWPACSGRTSMNTNRCSASSHTASVSFGRKLGPEPSSRSYQVTCPLVVGDRNPGEEVDRHHGTVVLRRTTPHPLRCPSAAEPVRRRCAEPSGVPLATTPSSTCAGEHSAHSAKVAVTGHLMDTGILARVLDDVLEYGGDYRIESLDLGPPARGRVRGRGGGQRRRRRAARPDPDAGADARRQRRRPRDGDRPGPRRPTASSPRTSTRRPTWRPSSGSTGSGCGSAAGDGLRPRGHRGGRRGRSSAPCRSAT